MKVEWKVAVEEDIEIVESAFFGFLSLMGMEPDDIVESRVERAEGGYVLCIEFRPSARAKLLSPPLLYSDFGSRN